MTAPMTDPATIAASRSEAQRRALLAAEPDGQLGNYFIRSRWNRDLAQTAKALHESGLTTIVWSGLMLNSVGLAVRQHLMEADRG